MSPRSMSGRRSGAARTPAPGAGAERTPAERALAARSHYGPATITAASMLLIAVALGSGLFWLTVFGFAVPLHLRRTAGRSSAFVAAHATESLNFQLTWLLITAIATAASALAFGLWMPVTVPAVLAIDAAMLAMAVRAGKAAARGEAHRYPVRIEFV